MWAMCSMSCGWDSVLRPGTSPRTQEYRLLVYPPHHPRTCPTDPQRPPPTHPPTHPARRLACQAIRFTAPSFDASVPLAARDFISSCLSKDPSERPSVKQLLRHPWLLLATGGEPQSLFAHAGGARRYVGWAGTRTQGAHAGMYVGWSGTPTPRPHLSAPTLPQP